MNAADNHDSEILRCEHLVWQAVVGKDVAQLNRLFTDDYIEVTLAGQRILKSDVVAESPLVDDIKAYSIDTAEVRTLSSDVVLLSYHLTLDGTCRQVPIVPRERWATSIWIRRKTNWQCSFFQQSAFSKKPTATSDETTSHSCKIHSMTVEHIAEAAELWNATEGLILTHSDNATDLARHFADNPEMSHVAVHDGRIVGAVLCGHDGRRGYLHHLTVAPEFRGRGIGRALTTACLSKLSEAGIRQCNLFIVDDNHEGRQFWSNEGWMEWPNIRLMSKHLDRTNP